MCVCVVYPPICMKNFELNTKAILNFSLQKYVNKDFVFFGQVMFE